MTIEGRTGLEAETAFDQITSEFNRRIIDSDLYKRAYEQAKAEGKVHEYEGAEMIMFGEGADYWIVAVVASEGGKGVTLQKADRALGKGKGIELAKAEGYMDLYYVESSDDDLPGDRVEITDPAIVMQKAKDLFAEFEAFSPNALEIHRYLAN